jgi:hypothetical protein
MQTSLHESACHIAYQVQRLTTLLAAGQSPKDLRGLHNNRPRAISHYCFKNNLIIIIIQLRQNIT